MKEFNEGTPILDVPYYKQTHFATCGSAVLMMVMKYWDKSFEMSKEREFELWKRSNTILFMGGILQFGLAKTALEMGYKPDIYQKARLSENYFHFKRIINYFEQIVSYNIRSTRIPIIYGKKVLDVIYKALSDKIPPIVFLNLHPIIGENVFHWVVVTGLDKENVFVNDPYIPNKSNLTIKKNHPVNINKFKEAIATDQYTKMRFPYSLLRLPPCAVLIKK